jgi:hypothetical protein
MDLVSPLHDSRAARTRNRYTARGGTLSAASLPGRCVVAEKKGLGEDAIARESATVLPEREAMSIIEPPIGPKDLADFAAPTDPSAAPTTGQGIDEKLTPE